MGLDLLAVSKRKLHERKQRQTHYIPRPFQDQSLANQADRDILQPYVNSYPQLCNPLKSTVRPAFGVPVFTTPAPAALRAEYRTPGEAIRTPVIFLSNNAYSDFEITAGMQKRA
jgi:hypothetical protein